MSDFQQTFTPSKSKGKSPHLQLFSPPGKTSLQSMKEENTLKVRSSEYMTFISCVKHDLMVTDHQFLFEKMPKGYINKMWAVIEKNDILVEKHVIEASAETSQLFFNIAIKYFPEFLEGDGFPSKLCQMLECFSAVNCISFAEVSNFQIYLFFRFQVNCSKWSKSFIISVLAFKIGISLE